MTRVFIRVTTFDVAVMDLCLIRPNFELRNVSVSETGS